MNNDRWPSVSCNCKAVRVKSQVDGGSLQNVITELKHTTSNCVFGASLNDTRNPPPLPTPCMLSEESNWLLTIDTYIDIFKHQHL